MTDTLSTFAELGFLSDEMQENRASHQLQYAALFSEIYELCKLSIPQLLALPNGDISYGHLLGRSFWWRCIENCHATIQLADLGMASSAMSTVRSAWEHLFYACALWRNSALVEEVLQKDRYELDKQINQIQTYVWDDLSKETQSRLLSIRPNGDVKSTGLSAFDAAKAADLVDVYCISYRGLSLTGAHSTAVSAFRALPDSEHGGHDLKLWPEFDITKPILENVCMCLTTGHKRIQELSDSLNPSR